MNNLQLNMTTPETPAKMEPKYRTLIQAALITMVLAFVIGNHSSEKSGNAVAQKGIATHR